MNTWSSFTVRANINASTEEIYKCWATQSGIESWFLRSAVNTAPDGTIRDANTLAQAGDSYTWYWHGYTDDVVEHGKILEANGKDLFRFTFTGNCPVSVTLSSKGGITIVELKQEDIPEDKNADTNLFVHCQIGWTFYLANLKSILEGGIDLRNKDVELLTNFK